MILRALVLALPLLASLSQAQTAKARPKPKKGLPAAPAVSTPTASGLPLLAPPSGPITVDMVIARLEDFDAKVKTLSADFQQLVRMEDSGVDQKVEGALEYHKPNLLRLEHRLPERQTIVADGTWLWVWRRDNNQVVQTRLEEWRKSEPLAQGLLDFGNYSKLLKTYQVAIASVCAPGADGHRSFEAVMRPREKPSAFTLTLRMTTADFFATQTELRAGAVVARTTFVNVRYNPAIAQDRFQFTPPAGADVFKNFKAPRTP